METKLVNSGFGGKVVETSLFFTIVSERNGYRTEFAVYMRHGYPAYSDWYRSCVPIRRFDDLTDARWFLDTLAGVADAYKEFPFVSRMS